MMTTTMINRRRIQYSLMYQSFFQKQTLSQTNCCVNNNQMLFVQQQRCHYHNNNQIFAPCFNRNVHQSQHRSFSLNFDSSAKAQREDFQNGEQQQQQEHKSSSTSNKKNTSNRKKYARWGAGGALFILIVSLLDLFEPVIMQKLLVKIELDEHDEAFNWVMDWLAQHSYTEHCTNLSVLSSGQYHKGVNSFLNALLQVTLSGGGGGTDEENEDDESGGQSKKQPVLFVPGPGRHFLKYKGHLMWIDYHKESNNEGGDGKNGSNSPTRSLTLTILNPNILGGEQKDADRRKLITDIIVEAKSKFTSHKVDKTTIFCPDRFCERWEEVVRKPKRPISSVILQESESLTDIINDVKQFIADNKFYADRGIPYRRGYLLYGPPGSGKTSTVQVIAGELGYDIYMLNISSAQMSDEKLNYLLHQAPKKSIVLLEDVDSCTSATMFFPNHEEGVENDDGEGAEFNNFHAGSYALRSAGGGSEDKVTVSGLLNAIDGVGAQEGRILFFTTNHANRLQKALLRPGRIDVKKEIGYTTPEQARNLFLSFYRDCTQTHNLNELADGFVSRLFQVPVEGGITPAILQGLFMLHKNKPEAVEAHLPEYIKSTLLTSDADTNVNNQD